MYSTKNSNTKWHAYLKDMNNRGIAVPLFPTGMDMWLQIDSDERAKFKPVANAAPKAIANTPAPAPMSPTTKKPKPVRAEEVWECLDEQEGYSESYEAYEPIGDFSEELRDSESDSYQEAM